MLYAANMKLLWGYLPSYIFDIGFHFVFKFCHDIFTVLTDPTGDLPRYLL